MDSQNKQKTPIEELIERWEKEREEAIRECHEYNISGLYDLFIKDAKEMLPKEREVIEKTNETKLLLLKFYDFFTQERLYHKTCQEIENLYPELKPPTE